MNTSALSKRVAGQIVSHVEKSGDGSLVLHFQSGAALAIRAEDHGMAAAFQGVPAPALPVGPRPTPRQREYLDFIKEYMLRYGVSPSDSDIQVHFMVSAPSAHQMVKTLEQRGFITRERDLFTGQAVPRSIRIVVEDL